MNISFSPYAASDYPELLSVTQQIWQDSYSDILSAEQIKYMLGLMYSRDKIEGQLKDNNHWELARNNMGSIIGYLHYYIEGSILWLSKIYLSKEYWHQNISTLMLERVIQFAQDNLINTIYLTVNKYNMRAQKFYLKQGFENIEEKIFDIGNGYIMDDFIFRKTL